MQFEEALKFEGNAAEIWRRASAIREIPSYWHGTRSLDVVSEGRGKTHAKVRFAFGGSGRADITIDHEKRTMTVEYLSGPFVGKQVVAVHDESVVASWDVKFRGVFRFASRWNEGHFRSGTKHALERLARGEDAD